MDSNFTTVSLVPCIFDLEEQAQAPFSQTEAEFSNQPLIQEMAGNLFSPLPHTSWVINLSPVVSEGHFSV